MTSMLPITDPYPCHLHQRVNCQMQYTTRHLAAIYIFRYQAILLHHQYAGYPFPLIHHHIFYQTQPYQ